MNLIEWVMEHWDAVEGDFHQFYGEPNPLLLGWRQFTARVRYLPPDSRTMILISQSTSQDERPPFAQRLADTFGWERPETVIHGKG